MRLLFLNHNVVGSGTFFRAYHFARQLVARGHQVTLVTTSRTARFASSTYTREGVELIESPDLLFGRGRTGWDLYNTQVRKNIVRRRQFDTVHAFDSRPAVIYPALAAVNATGALLVMDWADWWGRGGWIQDRSGWFVRSFFGPIETWFEESFRREARGMTVISTALAQRTQTFGFATDRILPIPQGCDPDSPLTHSRATARRKLGLSSSVPVVLHVGVLTRADYALLTAAFEKVRARCAQAVLVLAGRTGMPIRRPDPRSGVVLTGPLDDDTLSQWLAAANVCVVPTRDTIGNRGRWPSKGSTYMVSERAVVMPRVGDLAAVIERTGSGWVTEPSVDAFADGIVGALLQPAAADEAGKRGRATAQGELAWPALTERLSGFYDYLRLLP